MSNRKTLMQAIQRAGTVTVDELCDQIPNWSGKKIRDTLKDVKTAALVTMVRDDVTGGPAYHLTLSGKNWLEKNATSVSDSPAGGGACNTGSSALVLPVGDGSRPAHPAKGAAVVERTVQAQMPVSSGSDEQLMISGLQSRVQDLHDQLMSATTQRNAWREMAEMFGHETPVDLAEYISELRLRIASLEANRPLPLETTAKPTSTAAKRIAMVLDEEAHDTIDEAMRYATTHYTDDVLRDALVVEITPIGRVEQRPVFVPVTQQ